MPIRTSPDEVKAVIDTDLSVPEVDPFITTASLLVDEHLTDLLSDALLTQIETYLAAHLITLWEPRAKSESADGVAFSYEGAATGEGLRSSRYGQLVLMLDSTGTLANLDRKKKMPWLVRVGNERDVEG